MFEFDDEDEKILGEILYAFINDFRPKFRKGKEEHGGRITDMTEEELDYQELMELLDLVAYKYTRILKRKNDRKTPPA